MKSLTECDDSQLAERLHASDRAAFEEIYRRHWLRVYRTALFTLQSKELAEDITQELFVILWQKRERIRIRTSLAAYLGLAARNMVISHIRNHVMRRKNTPVAADSEQAGLEMAANDLMAALEAALEQLPAKSQEIFRMSRFEELPVREIANRVSLSEKAVEYHITKSLKVLRAHLKEFVFWAATVWLPFF
ncbi:MAG: RNA polymerase sigma-70 factor [Cytophagales bacterium]|nr:RNA polymerase sigma-70 factor [Cytophagales bacterium]